MKANIEQIGLISNFKAGNNAGGKCFITFSISSMSQDRKKGWHNYVMGGKLAEFWMNKIQNGDLVSVEGYAKTDEFNGKTSLTWSVESFQFEGRGLPILANGETASIQSCDVKIKGTVCNINKHTGSIHQVPNPRTFYTFGIGCKPKKSGPVIFFNVSLGEALFTKYQIVNQSRVTAHIHLSTEERLGKKYNNWYVDKIIFLGQGYAKLPPDLSKQNFAAGSNNCTTTTGSYNTPFDRFTG